MVGERSLGVNSFSPGDRLIALVNRVKLLLGTFHKVGLLHFGYWFSQSGRGSLVWRRARDEGIHTLGKVGTMSPGKQDLYFSYLKTSPEVKLEYHLTHIKSESLTYKFQGGNDICWKNPFSVSSKSAVVAATNKVEVSNGGTHEIKRP